jgi:hypothetical protein
MAKISKWLTRIRDGACDLCSITLSKSHFWRGTANSDDGALRSPALGSDERDELHVAKRSAIEAMLVCFLNDDEFLGPRIVPDWDDESSAKSELCEE